MSAAGQWLIDRIGRGDTEAAAVAVILFSPPFEWEHDRIDPYLDEATQTINFDRMLQQGWSSGERVLLELARNLWSGSGSVDVVRLAGLEDRFLVLALEAIEARRSISAPLPLTAWQRHAQAARP